MKFVPMDIRHWNWINDRVEIVAMADTKGVAAEDDRGNILGVCVCDSWSHTSVQLHIAIDNPICLKNGRFQKAVFDYIFNQAGRKIAYGLTPSKYKKALRLNEKIGFRTVAVLPDAWDDGVAIVIQELRAEDCKWVNLNGQEISSRAA